MLITAAILSVILIFFKKIRKTLKEFSNNRKLKKIKEGVVYKNTENNSYSRIILISSKDNTVRYREGQYGSVILEELIVFIRKHETTPIKLKTPEGGDIYIHPITGLKAIVDKIVGDRVYYYAVDDNIEKEDDDISYHYENLYLFELCWKLVEEIKPIT